MLDSVAFQEVRWRAVAPNQRENTHFSIERWMRIINWVHGFLKRAHVTKNCARQDGVNLIRPHGFIETFQCGHVEGKVSPDTGIKGKYGAVVCGSISHVGRSTSRGLHQTPQRFSHSEMVVHGERASCHGTCGSNLSRDVGCPQSLQTNAGIAPSIGHDHFLPVLSDRLLARRQTVACNCTRC
jgi:hypothetical protein